MKKPRIFVGSSSEQLPFAKRVAVWLDQEDCAPILWTDSFDAGDYTLERLLEHSRKCDGAVMIFGEDDKTWFREEELVSPRDNVVYELGLFTGAAKDNAVKRVVFCRVGKSKIASDLNGVSFVNVDKNDPERASTQDAIRRYAKRLKKFEAEYEPSIFQQTTKRDLFRAGSQLISTYDSNVTLAAKTPVPIMGPRPYKNIAAAFDYETEQFDLYWKLAERASTGGARFNLIASVPGIIEDLKECRTPEFHDRVRQNLHRVYSLAASAGSKLNLFWHDGLSPPAFLVANHASLMWWKGGNEDSIWVMHESPSLASALSTSSNRLYDKLSIDVVMARIDSAAG